MAEKRNYRAEAEAREQRWYKDFHHVVWRNNRARVRNLRRAGASVAEIIRQIPKVEEDDTRLAEAIITQWVREATAPTTSEEQAASDDILRAALEAETLRWRYKDKVERLTQTLEDEGLMRPGALEHYLTNPSMRDVASLIEQAERQRADCARRLDQLRGLSPTPDASQLPAADAPAAAGHGSRGADSPDPPPADATLDARLPPSEPAESPREIAPATPPGTPLPPAPMPIDRDGMSSAALQAPASLGSRPTRQARANAENAKRSTGPRTAAGKHRSSQNARRHGLSAKIVPGSREAEIVEEIAQMLVGADGDWLMLAEARVIVECTITLDRITRIRASLAANGAPRIITLQQCADQIVPLMDAVGTAICDAAQVRRAVASIQAGKGNARDRQIVEKAPARLSRSMHCLQAALLATDDLTTEGSEQDPLESAAGEWLMLDRYERRALSRRATAIGNLDRMQDAYGQALKGDAEVSSLSWRALAHAGAERENELGETKPCG